ncbi:MAG: hypothetical protein GF332_03175 [Candidatus Moranbacteria bacterium]|nr:hypothetical protein [Candidatus Moranbacteria bacterium]
MLKIIKMSRGVLGMNSRNLDYIRLYNKKKAKQIADNKLLTKEILIKKKLGVSNLLAKIETFQDLENFDWKSLPNSFVLKPNRGLGGEGIIVAFGRKKNGNWVRSNGEDLKLEDLKNHILTILEGGYSISGVFDSAFFEERVQILKLFKPYSYKGIPDIRVIVFNMVPVMAMLRLPTRQSGGRANLHLGGICAGIDMNTGVTTTAIIKNMSTQTENIIDYVPNTRLTLSGIKIPHWNKILEMSVKSAKYTGIGFLGVDIMIDRDKGPLIAELNARPGLAIQIANLAPLKYRLRRVEGLKIKTSSRGVRVGKDLFGGEIEDDVEEITGKKVVGVYEDVIIKNPNTELQKKLKAKLDTGAYSTSIATEVARSIGYKKIIDIFDTEIKGFDLNNISLIDAREIAKKLRKKYVGNINLLQNVVHVNSSNGITIRPKVVIDLNIKDNEIRTTASINPRRGLRRKIIIGRKDMKNLIVDPNRIKNNIDFHIN